MPLAYSRLISLVNQDASESKKIVAVKWELIPRVAIGTAGARIVDVEVDNLSHSASKVTQPTTCHKPHAAQLSVQAAKAAKVYLNVDMTKVREHNLGIGSHRGLCSLTQRWTDGYTLEMDQFQKERGNRVHSSWRDIVPLVWFLVGFGCNQGADHDRLKALEARVSSLETKIAEHKQLSRFTIGDCIMPNAEGSLEKLVRVVGVGDDGYQVFSSMLVEGRLTTVEDYKLVARATLEKGHTKVACPSAEGSFSPERYLSEHERK